ncbi:MAG: MGH1-like glycoside hydrolase domain-containing protein [Phototrophicaceae bacterium]
MSVNSIAEYDRLNQHRSGQKDWLRWGPYLSDRAWGTVREDYSADGSAWDYFPHDHARSRAYRWGEDGLGGISDDRQYLCFAPVLWNGVDPILKERFFGLTGPEGNHGEDVKEYYFYLDSTPTHSYMKMLYKYPQRQFPYSELLEESRRRGFEEFEYELLDTGVFDDNRYFDVLVEYAKANTQDIVIRISITNHSAEAAELALLPTIWFRNTWSWGYPDGPMKDVPKKPSMWLDGKGIVAEHPALGTYYLYGQSTSEVIFTENETNSERLHGVQNHTPYVKDAFHRYLIEHDETAVNPQQYGTKSAMVHRMLIAPHSTQVIHLRLAKKELEDPLAEVDEIFKVRIAEADSFYEAIADDELSADAKHVQRQALAGMLWSKQLFYYDLEQWLNGDPIGVPPDSRKYGRNHQWKHLNNFDIISMPDKWEYPWYAGWDLAFHCVPLAMVDTTFAKQQLLLLTREWYMHPSGQLPAYEWALGDVNPPVHAWAAWHVYEMDGKRDRIFLKRIFNKMLLNFTWWVNRKDADGNNVFQGGFLGLDNISLFDRSSSLPTGGHINQSDGTAWMGFYSLVMMNIALELAHDDPTYEDMAIKFYEHFLWIAQAISGDARDGVGLWDETDGFFYDVLKLPNGEIIPLKVRSLVGLMPLIAVETVGQATLDRFADFSRSIDWLRHHRPNLASNLASDDVPGYGSAHLFAMPTEDRLRRVLHFMLDEREFLSPFGIRSISKVHEQPYHLNIDGQDFHIQYNPAESKSGLFGGNSNWRGPIWFPLNYLLIESLRKYHRYYGDDFQIECPTGSGVMMNLEQVADDLARRLCSIFLLNVNGQRPVFGGQSHFQHDERWRDHLLFHEYFHGDNGAGIGASHQTGWTGLVAKLLRSTANQ